MESYLKAFEAYLKKKVVFYPIYVLLYFYSLFTLFSGNAD